MSELELSFPLSPPKRHLLEAGIDLNPGSQGQCRVTTCIGALSDGRGALATGTMFSVTAKQDIEILSFEFSHFPTDSVLTTEIYTRQGNDFLNVRENPEEWALVTHTLTTGVVSLDEGDENIMIVPRADMNSSVPLTVNAGDSRSFYLTLKSQRLRLEELTESSTGAEYISDSMMQTNVGIGVRLANFGSQIDENRAFQGRIHYRSIQDCNNYMGSTKLVLPFVIDSALAPQDANAAFQSAFNNFLTSEIEWPRLVEKHNLELASLEVATKETKTDCSQYGLANSCIVYDNTLSLTHFQSLTSKEIELELLRGMESQNYTISPDDNIEMTYIGDQLLRRYYVISLLSTSGETLLNPFQRDYIGEVTFDFLNKYSDVKPSEVDILGQQFSRRTKENRLREGRRHLQVSIVRVDAFIFGVGSDENNFFNAIEDTFQKNENSYRRQLQTMHNRPGAINEEGDFGSIFEDVFRISVTSNETVLDVPKQEDMNLEWVIIWSSILGVSFLFLVIRCYLDCCAVEKGQRIEKGETLSARVERKSLGMDNSLRPPNPFSRWRNPELRTPARTSNTARMPPISEPPRSLGDFERSSSFDVDEKPKKVDPRKGLRRSNSFSGSTHHERSSYDKKIAPSQRVVKRSNSFNGLFENVLQDMKATATTDEQPKAKSGNKKRTSSVNPKQRSKSTDKATPISKRRSSSSKPNKRSSSSGRPKSQKRSSGTSADRILSQMPAKRTSSSDSLVSPRPARRSTSNDRLISPNPQKRVSSIDLNSPRPQIRSSSVSRKKAAPKSPGKKQSQKSIGKSPKRTKSKTASKSPSRRRQQNEPMSPPLGSRRKLKGEPIDAPSSSQKRESRSHSRPRSKKSASQSSRSNSVSRKPKKASKSQSSRSSSASRSRPRSRSVPRKTNFASESRARSSSRPRKKSSTAQ